MTATKVRRGKQTGAFYVRQAVIQKVERITSLAHSRKMVNREFIGIGKDDVGLLALYEHLLAEAKRGDGRGIGDVSALLDQFKIGPVDV